MLASATDKHGLADAEGLPLTTHISTIGASFIYTCYFLFTGSNLPHLSSGNIHGIRSIVRPITSRTSLFQKLLEV
jgi:hypothetical protein